MPIQNELLDELLKNYKKPEDVLGENGIFMQFKKAILERILNAELEHHLASEKKEKANKKINNSKNGKSRKTLLSKDGELDIGVPRDRQSTFEPQIVKKHQRRFDGFDHMIVSLYARGMTVREIQAHLQEIYGVEVSPDLISAATEGVLKEVEEWQMRPLASMYAITYFDAFIVKIKENGHIINKAIYLAVGITLEGDKEVLGLWISQNEGASFWLTVINEIKNRGVKDILIACVDGLKGFPEAINAVFPNAQVQLCIVHMVRYSLRFVSWKDRKEVAADLKEIYTALNENDARNALDNLHTKWGRKYPSVADTWDRNWAHIVPFLAYPAEIRRVIYTTNTIESINRSLRKVIRNRTIFPNDKAAIKLVYLGLGNIAKRWNSIFAWTQVLNQLVIIFGDRVTQHLQK